MCAGLLAHFGPYYAGTWEDRERGADPRHRPDVAEIHHASQRAPAGECPLREREKLCVREGQTARELGRDRADIER